MIGSRGQHTDVTDRVLACQLINQSNLYTVFITHAHKIQLKAVAEAQKIDCLLLAPIDIKKFILHRL